MAKAIGAAANVAAIITIGLQTIKFVRLRFDDFLL
jgi:hypothetical protein